MGKFCASIDGNDQEREKRDLPLKHETKTEPKQTTNAGWKRYKNLPNAQCTHTDVQNAVRFAFRAVGTKRLLGAYHVTHRLQSIGLVPLLAFLPASPHRHDKTEQLNGFDMEFCFVLFCLFFVAFAGNKFDYLLSACRSQIFFNFQNVGVLSRPLTLSRVSWFTETKKYSFIIIISSTNKYRKHKSSMLI